MPHREGEGKAQGQLLVLHLVLVQEVRDALRDVVKQLEDIARWPLGAGLGQPAALSGLVVLSSRPAVGHYSGSAPPQRQPQTPVNLRHQPSPR